MQESIIFLTISNVVKEKEMRITRSSYIVLNFLQAKNSDGQQLHEEKHYLHDSGRRFCIGNA